MRIIDLCCGAGAVSLGYARAGWEVVGADIVEQPNYPFPFIRANALDLARLLPFFDAVHASPPCLRDTVMKHAPGAKGDAHPELIPQMRAMLIASGLPYVLENVMGAQLIDPVVLNGFMFGLGATTSDGQRWHLQRERKFETNWPLMAPTFTRRVPVIGVYGGHVRARAAGVGGRGTRDFVGEDKPRLMREVMGLGNCTQTMAEMSQAVPPAFTEFVGRELIAHLAWRSPPPASPETDEG